MLGENNLSLVLNVFNFIEKFWYVRTLAFLYNLYYFSCFSQDDLESRFRWMLNGSGTFQ